MLQLLKEILLVEWTQTVKRAEKDNKGILEASKTDIEGQQDGDNGDVNEQKYSINENVDRELYAALLSLSAVIFEKSISDGKDALLSLGAVIFKSFTAFSFARKLKDLVRGNSEPTPDCLRMLKITSKIIKSLIKLGVYDEAELQSLLNSLSNASKEMLELEDFMMLSSRDPSSTKLVSSLVKEAWDLLEEKKQQPPQNQANTSASSVSGKLGD